MRSGWWIAAISLPLVVNACGLSVPSMQEIGEPQERVGPDKNDLVGAIKCEIRNGVYNAVYNPNFYQPTATTGNSVNWLLDWGVKADLQVTVDDQGTFGPGVTVNTPFGTPTQSFSLGVGLQGSADALRKEEIGFAYPLRQLVAEITEHPKILNPKKGCGENGLFIHSDLKIGEFIDQNTFPARPPGVILPNGSNPFNAFNYTVQFIIIYSGSITPTWKLVRVSVNPNSPFASAMRTRTQYLTLTFGPLAQTFPAPIAPGAVPVPAPSPQVRLTDEAEAVHAANLIGQAVLGALQGSLGP